MAIVIVLLITVSCKKSNESHNHEHDTSGKHVENDINLVNTEVKETHDETITLTQEQLDILNIKVDTITNRVMHGFVQTNGQLEVPPQNEAIVTTILGANIKTIKVIEGDKVYKGQVLAYISHPSIIAMQTNYLQTYNKLTFLEQDYNRKKKLYDAKVGSGRDYQQAKSLYSSTKGLAIGLENQLQLLGISPSSVQQGRIAQEAPVISPINGYIEDVEVKTGQFVLPDTSMFEVVNTEHIHADLMVFESDITKIKKGQKVKLIIEALGNKELIAKIYSIGKSFEKEPKAVHLHAEIEHKDNSLIPGMYVKAKIITNETIQPALPNSAVFQEGDLYYVFVAEKGGNKTWKFTPKEVSIKTISDGFTAFYFKDEITIKTLVAQSGAYYLMAELKKSETEHTH